MKRAISNYRRGKNRVWTGLLCCLLDTAAASMKESKFGVAQNIAVGTPVRKSA